MSNCRRGEASKNKLQLTNGLVGYLSLVWGWGWGRGWNGSAGWVRWVSCVTFTMATPSRYGIFHVLLPQLQQWEDWLETILGIKDR